MPLVFISYQMFHNNWLIEGSVKAPLVLQGEKMADKYFLKPNGVVIQVLPTHDIKSLEERFVECDKDGKELKKVVKKAKKKAKVKDAE